MHKRYAVIHPTNGVFVGVATGLAFFSLLDAAGQTVAPVGDTPDELLNLLSPSLDGCSAVEVMCTNEHFANADELEAAGVDSAMLAPLRNKLPTPTHPAPRVYQ